MTREKLMASAGRRAEDRGRGADGGVWRSADSGGYARISRESGASVWRMRTRREKVEKQLQAVIAAAICGPLAIICSIWHGRRVLSCRKAIGVRRCPLDDGAVREAYADAR